MTHLSRRGGPPTEVNPIFLRKDWAGNTMEEYKTDGMWGWRTMVAHAAMAGKGAPPVRKGAQVRVMSFK